MDYRLLGNNHYLATIDFSLLTADEIAMFDFLNGYEEFTIVDISKNIMEMDIYFDSDNQRLLINITITDVIVIIDETPFPTDVVMVILLDDYNDINKKDMSIIRNTLCK